jgi:predicted permease
MTHELIFVLAEVVLIIGVMLLAHIAVRAGELPRELWRAMLIKRILIVLIPLCAFFSVSENPRLAQVGTWVLFTTILAYFAYSIYFRIHFGKMFRESKAKLENWSESARASRASNPISNAPLRTSIWTKLYGGKS